MPETRNNSCHTHIPGNRLTVSVFFDELIESIRNLSMESTSCIAPKPYEYFFLI